MRDDIDIPEEIIKAAKDIQIYFDKKSSGPNCKWELMGLCSRNYANELKNLKKSLKELTRC